MFRGTVEFTARIKGNGLEFAAFDHDPKVPGVARIMLEGRGGHEIRSVVHLAAVATIEEGKSIAARVNTAALDRIAYRHNLSLENARIAGNSFASLDPGLHAVEAGDTASFIGSFAEVVNSIDSSLLRAELQQASPPGECYFGLFRSARLSTGPVEEFMHLYNILLMLHADKQAKVDEFIRNEEPGVPEDLSGYAKHAAKGLKETIYTRLRNELGHIRASVSSDRTKDEMANRLDGLRALTKRAIELQP